jgi:hypothetical protein
MIFKFIASICLILLMVLAFGFLEEYEKSNMTPEDRAALEQQAQALEDEVRQKWVFIWK